MEVTSWDELKKTREALFEVEPGRVIKLRGITERERLKTTQESTIEQFNKETKRYEKTLNKDDFGYRLILAGWLEPMVPGATFEEQKEHLQDIGFVVLQRIAFKINELSGLSLEDIETVKNVFGPSFDGIESR